MSRLSPSRLLPAILLTIAIPSAPQAALSRRVTDPSGGDKLVSFQASTTLPQISDEERGQILMVRQRYHAAIQAFMKIQSPSAIVWNQMGIAYEMLFDYKDALRCFNKSRSLNPLDPIVLNNAATVQDGMGNFSGAEKNYRKSLKLNPNSAMVLKNLGTNLLMQHKYKEGSAAYKQALLLDPRIFEDHVGARVNDPAPRVERGTAAYFKARSCARAGLNDCAITFLRKAMSEGLTVQQVSKEQDFAPLRNTNSYTNLVALEQ